MKKFVITLENPNGSYVDLTAEEEAQRKTDITNAETEKAQAIADKEAKDNLIASAKAKLMAGEPMTEEEANLTLHI